MAPRKRGKIFIFLTKSSAGQESLMIHLPGQTFGCPHVICRGLVSLSVVKSSPPQTHCSWQKFCLFWILKVSSGREVIRTQVHTTSYENFEKILWLSKTLLVSRETFGVILVVRTTFESSGTTGRLRMWFPAATNVSCVRKRGKSKLALLRKSFTECFPNNVSSLVLTPGDLLRKVGRKGLGRTDARAQTQPWCMFYLLSG